MIQLPSIYHNCQKELPSDEQEQNYMLSNELN